MIYYNKEETKVGLIEVPNEISLCIVCTGCTLHCKDCHSKHNWLYNSGEKLDSETYIELLKKYKEKVSCITFMGGEWDSVTLLLYLSLARTLGFKTALYTGQDLWNISYDVMSNLDYIKVGKFIKEKGGLDNPNTNQKMYKNLNNTFEELVDITYMFQKGDL
jgi:anaerobic ribonucleoside-triphosphate reductase activating protein